MDCTTELECRLRKKFSLIIAKVSFPASTRVAETTTSPSKVDSSFTSYLLFFMKIYMMSVASLIFLITNVAAAVVDNDNSNNNTKISNGEQECHSDHFKENMQKIIQRELGTNNNSISDFDIAIKDGQVCVYMNDSLDERESDISQLAPLQDDNNSNGNRDIIIRDFLNENNNNDNCNGLSELCIHQGTGDNEINIEH